MDSRLMKIDEIYKEYQVLPFLQLHMYRVAAVAWMICDNTDEVVDTTNIVSACLLHDMGNIIKFNLDAALYPESFQPQGLDYWKKIKQKFINKYGVEEHAATLAIVKELNVSNKTVDIMLAIGFSKAKETNLNGTLSQKIASYADDRVAPEGVTSLRDRVLGGQRRYQINKGLDRTKTPLFEEMFSYKEKTEKEIFSKTLIKQTDINNASVASYIKNLVNYEIG